MFQIAIFSALNAFERKLIHQVWQEEKKTVRVLENIDEIIHNLGVEKSC